MNDTKVGLGAGAIVAGGVLKKVLSAATLAGPWGLAAGAFLNVGLTMFGGGLMEEDAPPPAPLPKTDTSVPAADPQSGLPIPYGKTRVPATIVQAASTDGDKAMWLVAAFGHGPISAVNGVYLDGLKALGTDARGFVPDLDWPKDFRGAVAGWVAYGTDGQISIEPRGTPTAISITNSVMGRLQVYGETRILTMASTAGIQSGDVFVARGVQGVTNGDTVAVIAVMNATQIGVRCGLLLDSGATGVIGAGGTLSAYYPEPHAGDVFTATEWPVAAKGKRIAYLLLRLLDLPQWNGNVPRIEVEVDGLAVQDPRTAVTLTITTTAQSALSYQRGAATTITANSTLVNFSAAHGLSVGQCFLAAGHNRAEVNGYQRVAEVTSATQVRIWVPLSSAGAGGTAEILVPSTNPILALRDYLISDVYGADADIDETAFADEATYCDTVVVAPIIPDLNGKSTVIQIDNTGGFGSRSTFVTKAAHGYAVNDLVAVSGLGGAASDTNRGLYVMAVPTATSFRLGDLFTVFQYGETGAVYQGEWAAQYVLDFAPPAPSVPIAVSAGIGGGLWQFTTTTPHRLPTGTSLVRVAGHLDGLALYTQLNANWTATRTGPTTFTIPAPIGIVNAGISGTMDRMEATAVLQCGGSVSATTPVRTNVEQLLTASRGSLVYQAGVYRPWIRRPRAVGPVVLTEANIVGAWEFAWPGSTNRANVVRATYPNGALNYVPDTVEWPVPEAANQYLTDDNGILARLDVTLPMTPKRGLALLQCQTMREEARTAMACTVVCTDDALQLAVGDRTQVTHPTPGWVSKDFWVAGVQPMQGTGTVRLLLLEYNAAAYTITDLPSPIYTPPTHGGGVRSVNGPPSATAAFTANGGLIISASGLVTSARLAAAVSTAGFPTAATVDAATGGFSQTTNPAQLGDSTLYADGTTVYISVRSYLANGTGSSLTQFTVTRDSALDRDGRQSLSNPEFSTGSLAGYTAYDNNATGRVTLSAVTDIAAPNGTGKAMRVTVAAPGAAIAPGVGGFYRAISADGGTWTLDTYHKGGTYIWRIKAKIPVGYTLNWASNAFGTGGTIDSLTSMAGTGVYTDYLFRQVIGTAGSFSSTGFFYLTGADAALTWDIAQCKATLLTIAPQLTTGFHAFTGQILQSVQVQGGGEIFVKGTPGSPDTLDSIPDGASFARTLGIALDGSGHVDLSASGVVGTVSSAKIANAAVIAAKLAALAVTTDKILVAGRGAALNDDPAMSDASAWTLLSGAAVTFPTITDGIAGNTSMKGTTTESDVAARFVTFDPLKQYRIRTRVRSNSANGVFYLAVILRDSAGANIGGGSFWFYPAAGVTVPAGPGFTEYVGKFGAGTANTFPSNGRTMAPGVILNYGGSAGNHEVQDLRIDEVIQAGLIAADTITANEIAANAIGASEIAAGAVTAVKISVAQLSAISADVGSITAGTLSAIKIRSSEIDTGYLRIRGVPFQPSDGAGAATTADRPRFISASQFVPRNVSGIQWDGLSIFNPSPPATFDGDAVIWVPAGLTLYSCTIQGECGASSTIRVRGTGIGPDASIPHQWVTGGTASFDSGNQRVQDGRNSVYSPYAVVVNTGITWAGTIKGYTFRVTLIDFSAGDVAVFDGIELIFRTTDYNLF